MCHLCPSPLIPLILSVKIVHQSDTLFDFAILEELFFLLQIYFFDLAIDGDVAAAVATLWR